MTVKGSRLGQPANIWIPAHPFKVALLFGIPFGALTGTVMGLQSQSVLDFIIWLLAGTLVAGPGPRNLLLHS